MGLKQIDYRSPQYFEMVALRAAILREPLGLNFSPEELAKEENDIFIGSYDEDELLGCCILTPLDNKSVRLRQMAVKGSLQGKGIGAAILGFAEKLAKDKGFEKIILHARDTVLGFYEHAGYHIVSDEFIEVGIPHHVMEKSI
jgi:predicted GNAT family N-acyltransferase